MRLQLFVGQTSVGMADTAAVIWAAPVLSRSYAFGPISKQVESLSDMLYRSGDRHVG